jgi:hypothetical protein
MRANKRKFLLFEFTSPEIVPSLSFEQMFTCVKMAYNQLFKEHMKTDKTPIFILSLLGIGTAISLLGDATLYTVLPHPNISSLLGITLSMVGLLLGANRAIRLVLNGPVGILYDHMPRRGPLICRVIPWCKLKYILCDWLWILAFVNRQDIVGLGVVIVVGGREFGRIRFIHGRELRLPQRYLPDVVFHWRGIRVLFWSYANGYVWFPKRPMDQRSCPNCHHSRMVFLPARNQIR